MGLMWPLPQQVSVSLEGAGSEGEWETGGGLANRLSILLRASVWASGVGLELTEPPLAYL